MSRLRNTSFQSLFGIVAIIIAAMLIVVVGSSFTAISLGISSSLKASSSGDVLSTGNTGSSVSNLDGIHNPLSSNHLYFTHYPSLPLGLIPSVIRW